MSREAADKVGEKPNEGPRATIEDALDGYFRLAWSVGSHHADVIVHESDWIDDDGNLLLDAEPYLSGHVRWDGCTELSMGRPHWCGPAHYVRHGALLKHIYLRAFALMGREPDEAWPA